MSEQPPSSDFTPPKPVNDQLSPEIVADYLSTHPDFLSDFPELLDILKPPQRPIGEGISDFQQSLISHLRNKVERTEDLAQVMISTSRDNLTSTTQIHECVLRLLAAESFGELLQIIENDLLVILELDFACICIENELEDLRPMPGIKQIPPTLIEHLIPSPHLIRLHDQTIADPNVFGAAQPLIKSEALVKLNISPQVPNAMLAFGSRDPHRFDPSQATELLLFMAKSVSELMRIWLALPSPQQIFEGSEQDIDLIIDEVDDLSASPKPDEI